MTAHTCDHSADSNGYLLVVERSVVICSALSRVAESYGRGCRIATGFCDAVNTLISEPPVAVVTSREISGLPGSSLVAAMNASPSHRAIPIAMLTSDASDCASDDVCPVFLKTPAIKGEITDWLDSLGLDRPSEPRRAENCLHGKKILIAEDTASMRRLLSHKLHLLGAQVTMADDGVEAGVFGLAEKFDLIVLDIEMPRLDGRDAISMLRDAGVRTPIVALTAHDSPEFISELFKTHGFNDVVAKADAVAGLARSFSSLQLNVIDRGVA